MGNIVAYLALLAWPLIALCLYRTLPFKRATIWTVLGAQLLLPVRTEIKIPMIPAIDKVSVATISALLGCFLLAKRPAPVGRRSTFVNLLLIVFFAGPVATSLLNNDTVIV